MLVRQSATYLVSNIVPAATTLCALAAYSHFLTSYEYGLVAWTLSTSLLAFNLGISWLCTSVVRLDSAAADRTGFQTTVTIVFCGLLLLLGVALLAAWWVIPDQ